MLWNLRLNPPNTVLPYDCQHLKRTPQQSTIATLPLPLRGIKVSSILILAPPVALEPKPVEARACNDNCVALVSGPFFCASEKFFSRRELASGHGSHGPRRRRRCFGRCRHLTWRLSSENAKHFCGLLRRDLLSAVQLSEPEYRDFEVTGSCNQFLQLVMLTRVMRGRCVVVAKCGRIKEISTDKHSILEPFGEFQVLDALRLAPRSRTCLFTSRRVFWEDRRLNTDSLVEFVLRANLNIFQHVGL